MLTPDFLSQILGLIRLRAERVLAAELTAPWSLRFETGAAGFVFVLEGEAEVTASDGRQVRALPGDLVVLPQQSGHLVHQGEAEPLDAASIAAGDDLVVRLGGGGDPARLILGTFRFEGDNMPAMLAVLPSVIHVPGTTMGEAGGWMGEVVQLLHTEAVAARPGAAILVSRLLDALVISAMRLWVRTAKPEDKGWLGALADPRISRALSAIHDEPFRHRSVAELAGIAGMSRSSFAERFSGLIGAARLHDQTPLAPAPRQPDAQTRRRPRRRRRPPRRLRLRSRLQPSLQGPVRPCAGHGERGGEVGQPGAIVVLWSKRKGAAFAAPFNPYRVSGLYVARFGLTASAPSLRTLSAS